MKIFVAGSKLDLSPTGEAEFDVACRALGNAIALGKHSVIVCSRSARTADPFIVQGMHDTGMSATIIAYAQQTEPKNQIETAYGITPLGPGQTPKVSLHVRYWNDEWRIAHLHAINEADAVLAIGGSSRGTQTVIYSAELMGKPVVLVPAFGGAAKDAWPYFRGRYYAERESREFSSTPTPGDPAWATSFIEAVKAHVARNPMRVLSKRVMLSCAVAAIVAVFAWVAAFLGAAEQLSHPQVVCLLLLCASMSGAMLRVILRSLGALQATWASSHPGLSGVASLLVSFGLFLLAELANFGLSGNTIQFKDFADVQRVGLSLSSMMFLASLFLEDAWARLAGKGRAYLEKV